MADWVNTPDAALLTDLYELTMAASYVKHHMTAQATFDLYVRKLPEVRNYLVVCGVEQAVEFLEQLRFDERALESLDKLKIFDRPFLDYLSGFRFTGEVWGIPEGEIAFAEEPILRVSAPLPEAQYVESFLLTAVSFQTMIASKAARVFTSCRGRPFVDFSLRRDHGPNAALLAARASYVGGAAATSNVLAAARYGIGASGTMAHSFVQAFDHEVDAFRQFAEDFPDRAVLLIDTYDTLTGARNAARVARELKAKGRHLKSVRIDSGDFEALTRGVRRILDEAGATDTRIFLSGDLDEHRIDQLLEAGAPVDAFGVGTQLGTSGDAPSLGAVYKLAAQDGAARMKLSPGKLTLPGRKQVFREENGGGFVRDLIGLDAEQPDGTRPLLVKLMERGRRLQAPMAEESVRAGRARFERAIAQLPQEFKALARPARHPVSYTPALRRLLDDTIATLRSREGLLTRADAHG